MALSPGIRLSERYEIIATVGVGGMGEVYRARDLRLGREVAIKVLPDHLSQNPQALSRFEREAKALAALTHPNILGIYDFLSHDGTSFAVMELLRGENLRSRLTREKLDWKKSAEIGIAVAEGLAAAHAAGVVHRDLKPENIFLTTDGGARILDFGLVRWHDDAPPSEQTSTPTISMTTPGIVMGTMGYMSPEQLRGEPVDVRSDIFSLGCVLHEMVSGNKTFVKKTSAETISAILTAAPSPLPDATPQEFQRLIAHCLEKDKTSRVQSARDVALQLKMILSDSAVRPLTVVTRKSKVRGVAWISLALALLVIGALAYYLPFRGKPIQSIAILPFVNSSRNPDTEYLSDGITESVMNSLAGVTQLRVMAHDTVFSYKGKQMDARKIGQELNVGAVVTGRVLLQGTTLVIRAELVNVSDGTELWGEQYQRKLSDVITIQEEIAKEVSEKLRLRLTGEDEKRLAKRNTENPEAQRLYLKGIYYYWKNTEEDYVEATKYFQQAIDRDPTFALAYAELGFCYTALTMEGYWPPGEARPKAEAAYKKALEIDNSLGIGHAGLGDLQMVFGWNWPVAEKELKLAILLDPGSTRPYWLYGKVLLFTGRFNEAIQEYQKLESLDPLSRVFSVNRGQFYTAAGKYDDAIRALQKTIKTYPDYSIAYLSLAQVYEAKGMYDQAAEQSSKAYHLWGDEETASLFANAHGASGYDAAKKELAKAGLEELKELAKEKYIDPIEFARLYAILDEKDEAFAWLDKAYNERSPQMTYLKVTMDWNNLRSDPRFAQLAHRIGLH